MINADFLIKGDDVGRKPGKLTNYPGFSNHRSVHWIIPTYKQLVFKMVPYFAGQYNKNSRWTIKENEEGITVFDAPKEFSAETIQRYIKYIHKKELNQVDDCQPFGFNNVNEASQVLKLCDFWSDIDAANLCKKFIRLNISVRQFFRNPIRVRF